MKPIDQMPDAVLRDARVLLTDLDDTLTESGRLPSGSLRALRSHCPTVALRRRDR